MGRLQRWAKVPENWLLVAAFAFVIAGSSITQNANFWILIAFLTFFGVFGRKAWRAIKTTLDGRRDKIQAELDEAQRLREEAQSVLADYERKKREAEEEATKMVESAKIEAERHANDARRALEETMRRREEAAVQRIQQAEADALREVREMAADLAVQATAELIRENLDETRSDTMIEKAIREVGEKLH
ncbi:MAG: F0F1 ATP synthase subunit B [Rhodospirillaceae bacterium]|nr:F0F1 ATP synthase subunit B [Rhodospirillaceae bacterium]|tara:strand:+ start:810 stop:1376 length:567 start_codon:yes stop_codon:yes gene_type:complete